MQILKLTSYKLKLNLAIHFIKSTEENNHCEQVLADYKQDLASENEIGTEIYHKLLILTIPDKQDDKDKFKRRALLLSERWGNFKVKRCKSCDIVDQSARP